MTSYVLLNSLGRVNKVEGQLSLDKMDRNTHQQRVVGKAENATGDEGGHLIASSLGGAGDRINMVPQARTLNRGDWKAMENFARRELEAGKNVSIKVDLKYPSSNSGRPNEFNVTVNVDGKVTPFKFNQ
ncbi:DNA/RNA non-specific endonuclease [uncultured Psychrobacter sp.]|uniref:DNA/RNA non-specific endonuclease n=1 Tax=uncultured Psychrobacter sp. TaxID=259303 RepID=UPI002620D1C4|nr:DNA/RNA non-specific endonuclease [uncultured Psychrobacter sp.]